MICKPEANSTIRAKKCEWGIKQTQSALKQFGIGHRKEPASRNVCDHKMKHEERLNMFAISWSEKMINAREVGH
jgi:hypothetical protein